MPPFQVVSCVSQQQPAHEVSVQQHVLPPLLGGIPKVRVTKAERRVQQCIDAALHKFEESQCVALTEKGLGRLFDGPRAPRFISFQFADYAASVIGEDLSRLRQFACRFPQQCPSLQAIEAADPWKEGFLARFPLGSGKGLPQQHPLHRRRDYVNRPDVVYTQHRVNADRQGQGVLLVTEPHSELNAGLVVVFSSAHPSIFNWSEWTRRCRRLPDSEYDSLLSSASEKVVQEFLKLLTK